MDVGGAPVSVPFGEVICHLLLQLAVQLHIAVVEDKVSQILLLDTIDHLLLVSIWQGIVRAHFELCGLVF